MKLRCPPNPLNLVFVNSLGKPTCRQDTRQAQGGVQASRGQAGHHAQPEAQLRLPATLGRNRPGGGLRADGPLKPDGHALDLRPLDQERKVPRPGEARKGIMGATEEGGREEAVGGENQTV